ncbi:MAG: precorrin-6y C5,15-methyltransferase (decarboxylating) subunit CbiE [Phormidesmis sp.]
MTAPLIHVVGVGLSGASSLAAEAMAVVQSATLLMGARRHLACMAEVVEAESAETWELGDFSQVFQALRSHLKQFPQTRTVILATGDPLFFGLGRLLLASFPADQLIFYPQVSAIQLAFSRLKIPWQDATLVSVHGRGEALLSQALKRGDPKIAVLTDSVLTPKAISALISALELPLAYQLWACENLGGSGERIRQYDATYVPGSEEFAPLNVVVLVRQPERRAEGLATVEAPTAEQHPLIGLPDSVFKGYADRPMLITKREIRLLILGAIAPLDNQVIWDIGAGTGSVSVELSRLCPTARIYAIEKTEMGVALKAVDAKRFAIAPITIIQGKAPAAFSALPSPNRVFIGGSSGQLVKILDYLHQNCGPDRIVLALATLEHLSAVTVWINQHAIQECWQYQLTQVNIARSVPVGPLTRLSPLNPVTILTLNKKSNMAQSTK